MLDAYEQKWIRDENRPFLILGLIFIAAALVMLCILSILFLSQRKASSPTAQPEVPLVVPTAPQPTSAPVYFSQTRLPVILSGSGSAPQSAQVTVQTWEVTKIKLLGHEIDGQHYDVATFRNVSTQETVKGYCINRGWETPAIGAEYTLNADGVFVPVRESVDDPLQRFQLIQ